MLINMEDITLVVESINDDSDQLKLYFGCKALKSILMVCTQEITWRILDKHSKRLLKRFVDILSYEHLEDLIIEVLHILVLITNQKEPHLISELVNEGLILGLNKFIETS